MFFYALTDVIKTGTSEHGISHSSYMYCNKEAEAFSQEVCKLRAEMFIALNVLCGLVCFQLSQLGASQVSGCVGDCWERFLTYSKGLRVVNIIKRQWK